MKLVVLLIVLITTSLANQCPPNQVNMDGCIPFEDAVNKAESWLMERMPPWDQELKNSLFGNPKIKVDGLGTGPASIGVQASIQAKIDYPWAEKISQEMWYDYNLPYANVDEPRNNWRPFLVNKASPLVSNLLNKNAKISDVVTAVNEGIWDILGKPGFPIKFRSSQTPLIYDPMSTITFGYASCTGISILFVDVLRSIGVCARLVGTPAWNNNAEKGNHNWVEVLMESETDPSGYEWGMMEG